MSKVNFSKLRISNIAVVSSDEGIFVSDQYEKQKIQASDRLAGDRFGQAVSINLSGDKYLVGTYRETTGGINGGSAYIINYNNSSGLWYEKFKFQSSDLQPYDRLGNSVSINTTGDKCIVGANQNDIPVGTAGAAYILNYNSSSGLWYEKQRIQDDDPNVGDRFGNSVSINANGDKCLIGEYYDDTGGSQAGAAYIFNYNSSSGLWYQKQKIQASDKQASDQFGNSVSINSEEIIGAAPVLYRAVIGAYGEDTGGTGVGAAYIFNYNSSSGLWYEKQKIQASDKQGGDKFGCSVSMNSSGNRCVLGAYDEDTGGSNAGAAYIFNYNNSSGLWYEKQKILASDREAGDEFGKSVSISSNGNKCIIGAFLEDTAGSQAGAAYIFSYNNSSGLWYEQQKIQSSDIQAGNNFGLSVSINANGNKCLTGAPLEDTGGSRTGSTYIFQASDVSELKSSGTVLYDSLISGELFILENDNIIKVKLN